MRYVQHAASWITLAFCGLVSAQQPGAHVSIQGSDGTSVSRISDRVAVVGDSPAHLDRRLSNGAMDAQIDGLLLIQQDGNYHFGAEVLGTCRITIDGQEILKSPKGERWLESAPVRLKPGFIPIRVEYQTSATTRKDISALFRLFWSGPGFEITEPVGGRYLFHNPSETNGANATDGNTSDLIQSHRCNACHNIDNRPALVAPSLKHLTPDTISRPWLVDWIAGKTAPNRHCPTYAFEEEQAAQIASYLVPTKESQTAKAEGAALDGSAQDGQVLFASIGCLACHNVRTTDDVSLGSSSVFGGGDLSQVAIKRPAGFFERWLKSPEQFNPSHRMPVFELSNVERRDLAAYLATLGVSAEGSLKRSDTHDDIAVQRNDSEKGAKLVANANCSACHAMATPPKRDIPIDSWTSPCPAPNDTPNKKGVQPRFAMTNEQRNRVRRFIEALPSKENQPRTKTPTELLAENNCFACHQRGLENIDGLTESAETVVELHSELAGQYAALIPPSLNQVGDKLTNEGLHGAITRK